LSKSKSIVSLLYIAILTLGCSEPDDRTASNPPVLYVEDVDAEMNDAISTAKKTLSFFEKNWQTMESDGVSVKFAIPTSDGELEHIWFTPTAFNGNEVTGRCANDPVKVPSLKLGDIRTVSRDDVSDWMIVIGNRCFGGYTIRVLAQREPGAAPPLEFVDPTQD
jgi:uncharacterized protein YegJ (DUF2314 family)